MNSVSVSDLNLLRSLVSHQSVTAKGPIKVVIQDKDTQPDRQYEIMYCNIKECGVQKGRSTAFQLKRGNAERIEYYLLCDPSNRWEWYDLSGYTLCSG